MNEPMVIRCENVAALAAEATAAMLRSAQAALDQRGRWTLVLAGGTTPEKTYELLAGPQGIATLDIAKIYFFLGDERFVPPDDPRSNFGMIRRSLLARLALPAGHVFPMPTEAASPAVAAQAYAAELARFFAVDAAGPPPTLDLVLLGLGDDGHTASLFPGQPALDERRAWVTWSPPGVLPPPVDRVTLSYATLNAARQVLFLVSGRKKAAVLRDVLAGSADPHERPAAGVRPTHGTVTWLVDADAASLL